MREININRQLLGIEDLLFGFGQVTQTRAGQSVDITKINAGNLPFDETQTLIQWAQNTNLAELGAMTVELQAIYNSIDALNNLEDNLVALNILAQAINCLNNLCSNLTKLQNIDTNMTKLQNIDTNMTKLQNIDTNMTKLQNIDTNMLQLSSIYTNMVSLQNIYTNMSSLLDINSQIIPHLSEILLVDDYAAQVALDKNTVASDKSSVASMKLAIETIYDTFDDRFLGTKTSDPTLDNEGNPLIDGAMYFNTSVNALKVYDLGNTTWLIIPQIYLSSLLDVTLTSITTGDILTWNGSKWINTRTPSFDSIKLNGGTWTNGTATWNNAEYTYDIVLNPNVTLQVGQEDLVYCKNTSASVIANGRPVMASGTNGNSGNILVDLHDGTKANARRIVGITTEDLTANGYGFVTRNGKVRGINTTGSQYGETWIDGDILYVKATGNLTKVEPADTALKMPIAFVIHAHTNGTLYVRTTGIDENHDRDLISTKVSKVTSTDNAIVRFNGTTGQVQDSSILIDDNGNLNITGVGKRITGDFSNSTISNRVTFQSSTDNSNTILSAMPNGTATEAYFSVRNTSDADNASNTSLGVTAGASVISATKTGTGSYLPLAFFIGGAERMRIDTSGNVGIGTASPTCNLDIRNTQTTGTPTDNALLQLKSSNRNSGIQLDTIGGSYAGVISTSVNGTNVSQLKFDSTGNILSILPTGGLGYGAGAGGTVTQLTNKGTTVTLNKPSGQIIMNNAALAAGASVMFQVNCSVCSHYDVLIATGAWTGVTPENYRIEATKISYPGGTFFIKVTNVSGTSLSEALTINFAIIKGANS